MKLLIDGEIYGSYPGHGIARMFNEIVPQLPQYGIEVEVVIRAGVSPLNIGTGVLPYIRRMPRLSPRLRPWRVWNPLSSVVNRCLEYLYWRSRNTDVFISTYYTDPPIVAKKICVIYDMIQELFPEVFEVQMGAPEYRRVIRRKRRAIQNADAAICISEHTKRDAISIAGIDEARCHVVQLGHGGVRCSESEILFAQKERPFLLYVGDYRAEYKNLEFVLRCLSRESCQKLSDCDLIVASRFEPSREELARYEAYLSPLRLHFRIGSTDEMIRSLYSRCRAFIYPSQYEGFGLPVLEALSEGAPVVCSNAASLPEVGGSVVYYFNPRSSSEFIMALDRALEAGRRGDLVRLRQEHARTFTWGRSATRIAEVVRDVCQGVS